MQNRRLWRYSGGKHAQSYCEHVPALLKQATEKRLGSSDDGILLKISSDGQKPGMILTAEGARIALGALQYATNARNCNDTVSLGWALMARD
jgi:hypothetical protein